MRPEQSNPVGPAPPHTYGTPKNFCAVATREAALRVGARGLERNVSAFARQSGLGLRGFGSRGGLRVDAPERIRDRRCRGCVLCVLVACRGRLRRCRGFCGGESSRGLLLGDQLRDSTLHGRQRGARARGVSSRGDAGACSLFGGIVRDRDLLARVRLVFLQQTFLGRQLYGGVVEVARRDPRVRREGSLVGDRRRDRRAELCGCGRAEDVLLDRRRHHEALLSPDGHLLALSLGADDDESRLCLSFDDMGLVVVLACNLHVLHLRGDKSRKPRRALLRRADLGIGRAGRVTRRVRRGRDSDERADTDQEHRKAPGHHRHHLFTLTTSVSSVKPGLKRPGEGGDHSW